MVQMFGERFPLNTSERLALTKLQESESVLITQRNEVLQEAAVRLGLPLEEIGTRYGVDLQTMTFVEVFEVQMPESPEDHDLEEVIDVDELPASPEEA